MCCEPARKLVDATYSRVGLRHLPADRLGRRPSQDLTTVAQPDVDGRTVGDLRDALRQSLRISVVASAGMSVRQQSYGAAVLEADRNGSVRPPGLREMKAAGRAGNRKTRRVRRGRLPDSDHGGGSLGGRVPQSGVVRTRDCSSREVHRAAVHAIRGWP